MTSSKVLDVLYDFFDTKDDKLKWKGSLEDLKAFVFTEIDEETADSTSWRSPSGGKWCFESKELAVTWQKKSMNIQFGGIRGKEVIERVHNFLQRNDMGSHYDDGKAIDQEGNVEGQLADVSSDKLSDDNLDESLVNRVSDIVSGLVYEHEKCRENVPFSENTSTHEMPHEQSSESSDANLHVRPSTSGKAAETKDLSSPGGTNKACSNCYNSDLEILILKSNFERFSKTVTTKIDDLAFEINVVKEDKPYAIVTLEGVIKELKEEKAELRRKNEELREDNINMHRTISQLSQSNKQLEEEKSSLVTALKLIQNDISNLRIENKTSGNKLDNSINIIDRASNSNAWIKPKHKYQSRPPTTSCLDTNKPNTSNRLEVLDSSISNASLKAAIPTTTQELENQDQDRSKTDKRGNPTLPSKKKATVKSKSSPSQPDNQSDNPPSQRHNTVDVAILGDSMIKFINPSKLRKSLKRNVMVKTFSGANVHDMKHYIKPTMEKKPDYLILHAGTNDLKYSTSKEISLSISMLGQEIDKNSPETKLIISEVIPRFDDPSYMPKIEDLNVRLKQVCANNNWGIITHRNIAAKQLNPDGPHLNKQGSTKLAGNFIEYFKHCN